MRFHWRPCDVDHMTVRQCLFLLGPRPRVDEPLPTEIDGIPVEAD